MEVQAHFAALIFTHFTTSQSAHRLARWSQGRRITALSAQAALYTEPIPYRWSIYHDPQQDLPLRRIALQLALTHELRIKNIKSAAQQLYQSPSPPALLPVWLSLAAAEATPERLPLLHALLNQDLHSSFALREMRAQLIELTSKLGGSPWAQLACLASPTPELRGQSLQKLSEAGGDTHISEVILRHLEDTAHSTKEAPRSHATKVQIELLLKLLSHHAPIPMLARYTSLIEPLKHRFAAEEMHTLIESTSIQIQQRSGGKLGGGLQLAEASEHAGALSPTSAGGALSEASRGPSSTDV